MRMPAVLMTLRKMEPPLASKAVRAFFRQPSDAMASLHEKCSKPLSVVALTSWLVCSNSLSANSFLLGISHPSPRLFWLRNLDSIWSMALPQSPEHAFVCATDVWGTEGWERHLNQHDIGSTGSWIAWNRVASNRRWRTHIRGIYAYMYKVFGICVHENKIYGVYIRIYPHTPAANDE